MGVLTLYAIKSALCLAVLYLPFTLLLRRETFFAFNRAGLLLIVGLSLVLPCMNVPIGNISLSEMFDSQRQTVIEVGLPIAVSGADKAVADHGANTVQGLNWAVWLVGIYMIGMVVCLVLKGHQLYRLLRFIPSGCLWTDDRGGVTIYCHAGSVGAFSWMRSIVVGEADSAPDSPVILHEMAHVRHRHSWDALLVALVEILQWFNPCIWMLDISLREIHEYEADDAVLRRGITARNYQLLLIKNAVRGSRYAFANAFNHSLLKKRITMMMKKKSNKWARMRLLYVVPATLIVLGAFASHRFTAQSASLTLKPTSAEQQKSMAEHPKSDAGLIAEEMQVATPEEVVTLAEKMTDTAASPDDTVKAMVVNTLEEKKVYDVCEVMPEFPGGMSELMKYIASNVKYPGIAYESGVQGRCIVSFVVSDKGKVEDVKISRGLEGEKLNEVDVVGYAAETDSLMASRINKAKAREAIEEEAMRVVKTMPDWTPGKQDGKPVNCKYSIPLTFKLQ